MAALLAVLVGCNKELQQDTPADVDGKVYMQFSVNMLTTRSATDENTDNTNSNANPDYEVGKDRENTISSVDIVLTPTNGTSPSVVAENVQISDASLDGDVRKTYVASFKNNSLTPGAEYYVYIYANCEAPVTNAMHNENATSDASIADMTKDHQFWMTNAYSVRNSKVILPNDMSLYTQPQNPYNLKEHYVERAMARFDYKAINNNVYTLGEGVTVTLTDAALINQSKKFYMLRRTSATGLVDETLEIGGTELMNNYVVDTDFEAKSNGYDKADEANFDYHMTLGAANWNWKSLTCTEEDNWTGSEEDIEEGDHAGDYMIWQYAKENTIPTPESNQQNGISTGVVFRGVITATNAAIAEAMAAKETIYVFENVLYGNWNSVVAAALAENAKATLVAAYNKVVAAGEAKTSQTYADAGFTGYSAAENGKYYTYYYYWNRHNDNLNNKVMDNMEFAVVRNNVYKLCVDNIAKFGHPTPGGTDPDPDPVDPTDPDEDLNYYFTVTVKVLPWVVRVNHIEF